MLRSAQERGLRVALDSFGPHQRPALEAGAWLLKPNDQEWEATWGEALDTDDLRWRALGRMASWGTEIAVLSLGSEGALALAGGERYRLLPAPVHEVNAFGGGDSMVAGICWAASQGMATPECLAWGAACGAANAAVWDPGGISRQEVERLLPLVTVRRG
jgi:fructose-1-phosphate kinase PfkB-like protein